jgi:hypothetical protein
MMRYGEEDARYSKVEVVNALANYFKHQDEWLGSWDQLQGPARQTAEIIRSIGAEEYSTGNLRTGARWLGVADDIRLLSHVVGQWRSKIVGAYAEDVKRLGL